MAQLAVSNTINITLHMKNFRFVFQGQIGLCPLSKYSTNKLAFEKSLQRCKTRRLSPFVGCTKTKRERKKKHMRNSNEVDTSIVKSIKIQTALKPTQYPCQAIIIFSILIILKG